MTSSPTSPPATDTVSLVTATTPIDPTATTAAPAAETPVPATDTAIAMPTNTAAASATDMPTELSSPTAAMTPTELVAQGDAAARVNGEALPMADYLAQIDLAQSSFRKQRNPSQGDDTEAALAQVRHQVLEWMIDQMLIEQAAHRMGITVAPDEIEAELVRARGDDPVQFAQWLQANNMTEATFRAKLESELLGAKMRDAVTDYLPEAMEQVQVRHILVDSREEGERLLVQIKSNNDFERLAKAHSLDMGTRENGGNLGYYPRGVLSPEIDRVAFNLVTGQISNVIQTSFGYHIIQVLDRQPERPLATEMLVALRQQAFMDWLAAERGRAEIEYLVE